MEQLGSHGLIFLKLVWVFLENLSRKFELNYNLTRITATLHEGQYTFLIISRSFLLRMGMFQAEIVEKFNTHILCPITFFPLKTRAFYEVRLKNNVEPGTSQMAIRCARVSCWVTKHTATHSQYVILIAFSLQQWWHERAWMLRYTHIASLVEKCVDYCTTAAL